MHAAGEQVIVKIPPKKDRTSQGIVVEQIDQRRSYGRLMSVGHKAQEELGLKGSWNDEVHYVVFDHMDVAPIQIDPAKGGEPDTLAVHYSGIFCFLNPKEVTEMGGTLIGE